jgi:hypothetical protein
MIVEYVLIHYCAKCEGYFQAPISDFMIRILKERGATTWLIAKKCQYCLNKEKNA